MSLTLISYILLWFVSTNRKNEARREQKMLKALHSLQWNKKYLSVYRTPCAAVDNFVKSNTYRAEIERNYDPINLILP